MKITKTFRIEVAHRLPRVPEGHKCGRLHGHSIHIDVSVKGKPDHDTGWIMDFADITAAWQPIHDALDHRLLNEIPGLENPTSENLARWLWKHINLSGLAEVVVRETCTSSCTLVADETEE